MESSAPSRMWDNLLSLVTESIDFELLPIPASTCSPPALVQQHSISQDSWSEASTSTDSEEDDEVDGGFDGAGGPPAPASADKPFTGGRCEIDGEGEDEIDGGLEEIYDEFEDGDKDPPSFGEGRPPVPFYPPNGSTIPPAIAGGPPPPYAIAGGPPPPPPPPAPPVAKLDPLTEAKQEINRLMMGLQKKLDDKTGGKTAEDGDLVYDALDGGGRKWADFQAAKHKMEVQDFLAWATKERKIVKTELEKLEKLMSNEEVLQLELKDVESATDILGEATQWFEGSSKVLKNANKKYEELESTIDTLMEFVQLRREMSEDPKELSYPDVQDRLTYTKKQFERKLGRWGKIIVSGADSWRQCKLPVCDKLLTKSRYYLCGLVVKFVGCSLTEANKVDTKRENSRAKNAVERLKESIQLLQTARPYFTMKPTPKCTCSECPEVNPTPIENEGSDSYNKPILLKLVVDVSQAYFDIGLGQFDGFVHKQGKQRICDHFQAILDLLKKVEDLVSSIPRDEVDSSKKKKTVAVITLLPEAEAEGLKVTMIKSREILCKHVGNQAAQIPSEDDEQQKRDKTKEVVHWMMFYCKYDCKMSSAIGCLQDSQEIHQVTTTVQIAVSYIENTLKQYDSFVHVLDRKRICGHFDCIAKVVDSLVSNIPTADGSPAARSLAHLHSGATLIPPIIRSCEKLVEHYGNHEESVVKGLQADVGEETKKQRKQRKEEATRWLIFGVHYFEKMVNALGPKFDTVMSPYKKLEMISQRVEAAM